jgi:hypothetical protein
MRTLGCVILALLIAGCGDEREAEAPAPADALTVTIHPKGDGGPKRTRTVDCAADPTSCAVPMAPTSPTTACTEIYGGPATATVTGTLDGKPVDAEFSLNNGCEISRWDKASALLGDPPAMHIPRG